MKRRWKKFLAGVLSAALALNLAAPLALADSVKCTVAGVELSGDQNSVPNGSAIDGQVSYLNNTLTFISNEVTLSTFNKTGVALVTAADGNDGLRLVANGRVIGHTKGNGFEFPIEIAGGEYYYLTNFNWQYIKEHSGMNVNDPVYQVSDHALFQLNTLLEKLLEDSKKAANEVLLKKRELRKQLNNVESYLSLDIDESTLEKIRNQMKEIEAEVVRIEVHIKDVQQKSSEINGKLTEKNAELRDAVDIYLKNAEFLDDSERMMKYSNLALRILNEYSVALQSRKARALSETITACYKKLASKKNLIERIEMDPETLDVHYFGEDGMIVDQGSLSAGEKQLMVISILWALAICSKKKLPVIIDTPLSRLDSTHRAALVTTYFPQASEQTIILSTDSEIDRHYYDMMQEYIGDEFTLNYSEETKSTTISRGYFQER